MCHERAARMLFLLLIAPLGLALAPNQEEEDEEEEQREITFVAGFKTGNSIGTAMLGNCFLPRSSFPHGQKEWERSILTKQCNWDDHFAMHPQWGRKVFMVRNPYEIFRSAYLYELDCQNRFECAPEMTMHYSVERMIPNTSLLREKPRPHELHNHYILRVSMAEGILSDMVGEVGGNVERMLMNYDRNFEREQVLTVCLGDIFRAFDSTTSLILKHLGIAPDSNMWKCLKSLDPSQNRIAHSTHSLKQQKRQEAMRIIKENDAKYFGGRFGRSPIALLCPQDGLE